MLKEGSAGAAADRDGELCMGWDQAPQLVVFHPHTSFKPPPTPPYGSTCQTHISQSWENKLLRRYVSVRMDRQMGVENKAVVIWTPHTKRSGQQLEFS